MRVIIFDLDNCLASARAVDEEISAPVIAAIRHANQGALTPDALDAALRDVPSWARCASS